MTDYKFHILQMSRNVASPRVNFPYNHCDNFEFCCSAFICNMRSTYCAIQHQEQFNTCKEQCCQWHWKKITGHVLPLNGSCLAGECGGEGQRKCGLKLSTAPPKPEVTPRSQLSWLTPTFPAWRRAIDRHLLHF